MKGILFKPDMHLAIREGRKTVTRRLLNPQPFYQSGVLRWIKKENAIDINMDDHVDLATPYARYKGDEVLYIKEAYWILDFLLHPTKQAIIVYPLNNAQIKYDWDECLEKVWDTEEWNKFRSPMFLREKFARDFIQITDVRAERLHEITKKDVIKEGIGSGYYSNLENESCYKALWDSINKKNPWSTNPWVWRYEFRLILNKGE